MESALDRFVRGAGAARVGITPSGHEPRQMFRVGVAGLTLGGLAWFGSVYWFGEPFFVTSVATPLLAFGGVGIVMGALFRSHIPRTAARPPLTKPARDLLRNLAIKTLQPRWGSKLSLPAGDTLRALERAAEAWERIRESAGREPEARFESAADAGMAEALHLAATGAGTSEEMAQTLQKLEELARLVAERPTLPGSPSPAFTVLDRAVEEIRAEKAARQELLG